MTRQEQFRLAFRFALREMRGGLKGFMIFLGCIILGVGAIGGVNGIAHNVTDELQHQGQTVLGGDIRFTLNQRPASSSELAFLEAEGKLSQSIWMRSMARLPDGSDQMLVEIKAVDAHYPLYGTLKTTPASDYNTLFAERDGAYGAVAPKLLFDRLQLQIGNHISVGNRDFILTAMLDDEPDVLSEGFQMGTRLFMAKDAIATTGLLQPGSLYAHVYKLKIDAISDDDLTAFAQKAEKAFPESGWTSRSRLNASQGLSSNIERFAQFLTLVGLTALLVGGVGIGNAVRSYLDSKRGVIATLKSVGATGRFITTLYYIQIMLISLIGLVIGLVVAVLIPVFASTFIHQYLPIIGDATIYPEALLTALIFALLTTSAFAILPLGRARDVPVTALFRPFDDKTGIWPRKAYLIAAIVLLCAIATLALLTSFDKRLAMLFIGAVIVVFIILRFVAYAIERLAWHCRHVGLPALRLAIGNIYRKGALTPSVVLALGLGLTLLVALANIDGNLRQQLGDSAPKTAPNFFLTDIAQNDGDAFQALIHQIDPDSDFKMAPTLRARITKVNGVPSEKVKVHPDGEWLLRGDRGITYAKELPENTILAEGQWWDKDQKTPLVSFSKREAGYLGLKLGDTISVNILGHEITATIYNLREVDWDSLNMNFVMIFPQNALQGAPHVLMGTLKSKNADDPRFMREISRAFPAVTVISVKEVMDNARHLVGQIGLAIRASASIALIASILVLAGALTAGNRNRTHDAIVFKTLGATRSMLIRAFIYEYVLLGFATALFAFCAGTAAGIGIAKFRMGLHHVSLMPENAVLVLVLALVFSVGLGLINTWRILGQKPAQYLKDL